MRITRPIKRPPGKAILASYKSAMRLDTIGMPVVVELDNGQLMNSRLASLPWTLGHGGWVVKVEGCGAGGYDCARIKPTSLCKDGKAVAA